MIDTGIYTSAQAKSFVADGAVATSQIGENPSSEQINRVIGNFLEHHPSGAQFSACDASYALQVPGYLGAFITFSIALVDSNGNCMQPAVYNLATDGDFPECGTPAGDAASHAGRVRAAKVAAGGGAFLVAGIIGTILSHKCD